jgi:hypothetical protein
MCADCNYFKQCWKKEEYVRKAGGHKQRSVDIPVIKE